MDKILAKLDKELGAIFPNIRFYGLAELVTKESTTMPVTVGKTTSEREKIAIDDRYDCIVYHRIINTQTEIDEDNSYGVDQAKKYTTQLRTVIASKVSLGEEFNREFSLQIPAFINVSGYDYINFMPSGFNEDHESIMQQEFITVLYHKHRTAWNVCAIDNEVEYLICRNGCADIRRATI